MPAPSLSGDSLFAQLILTQPEGRGPRPAFRVGKQVLSYDDLKRGVASIARELSLEGIRKGDRVGLRMENSPEYVIAFLSVTALGGIAVPVDAKSGAARLRHIIQSTRPKLFLLSTKAEFSKMSSIPQCSLGIDWRAKTAKLSRGARPPPSEPTAPRSPEAVDSETPAAILFSAGSTGRPKGVLLKHGHFLEIARTLSSIIGMNPDHEELVLSPMTHSGGWQRVTATLLCGGCVVLPEGLLTVTGILEDIRDYGITGFFTTPPLIRSLLKVPREKVRATASSCRSIEIASAPLSPLELEKLMELFGETKVFFQYGLTECSRAIILDAKAHPDKLHTIGKPTAGVEVAVGSENGRILPPKEEGEILLRADNRVGVYWEDEALNRTRFRDGWFSTGDFGAIDEDGFVAYHGRRDDMINCGGFSFFPAEVESEIGLPHGVKEYLIAGVPDPKNLLTEVPWAFVVPENPETWSVKGFFLQARKKLPPHMAPRRVVVIPALPLTATGKPNRRVTVEKYGPEPDGSQRNPD